MSGRDVDRGVLYMYVEEQRVILKNGKECILRSPMTEDAMQLINYLKVSAEETDFLLKYPEEVLVTLEEEQEILQWFVDTQRNVMIVAEIDGRIVGNGSFSPVGKKIRVRHRCSVGVALYKDVWGVGIGTALLELLFAKAFECGYEQMELNVVSRNERAIRLYEKMGFVKCGIRPNAMKNKDGTYDDDVIMVKEL